MVKKTTKLANKGKNKDKNFWKSLSKPFFVLAPMANVTDSVFRKMIVKYGKPDVMWTEFVSADGLMSDGREKLLHNLDYSKNERPIVAQLFTGHPVAMKGAAKLVAELGFDGLDINMGCPDRSVEKQGGGVAMMKDPDRAVAVLEAAREGVEEQGQKLKVKAQSLSEKFQGGIPVSVKTRIGYNKVDLDWIRILLEQKLPALTVHLRTRKEMSDVPAHWEIMPEIVKMRDEICPETLIIGNGDVESLDSAREMVKKYGCDGVMIGRGIFGKPWMFEKGQSALLRSAKPSFEGQAKLRSASKGQRLEQKTTEERLKILVEHTKLFEKTFRGIKNFDVMKKHFKAYVSGWDGAKELRVELMNCKNAKEVSLVVKKYLSTSR